MQIHFQLDFEKAIQSIAHIVRAHDGEIDKAKLMKLLYIADRDCFLKHERPITGDVQVAMPHGPLPSRCLDLVNGQYEQWIHPLLDHFVCENYMIRLNRDPGASRLDDADTDVLNETMKQYGHIHTWSLVRLTHEFPEYKAVYQEGTSTVIPYELMAKIHLSDDSSRFRHNRSIITSRMASEVLCPFSESETDF